MASAHIEISGAGRHNAMLRQFVDALDAVVEDAIKLSEGYSQTVGSPADDEALAVLLDLRNADGTPDTTTATEVRNLIGSVRATLTTDAFIAQVRTRMV